MYNWFSGLNSMTFYDWLCNNKEVICIKEKKKVNSMELWTRVDTVNIVLQKLNHDHNSRTESCDFELA